MYPHKGYRGFESHPFRRKRPRSSVVEQRPFKPWVAGSIPAGVTGQKKGGFPTALFPFALGVLSDDGEAFYRHEGTRYKA